ncbi:MAG: adenylate/guanylate cyclase domain-containing protein [Candidatus Binatia bacterium]
MHCPQCQHQNSDTAKFCEECGTKLLNACPQCGHQASSAAKFCVECGESLTGKAKIKRQKTKGKSGPASGVQRPKSKEKKPASTVLTLDPRPRDSRRAAGERRQLTVLFCDLVGSTTLSAQLDPEDYQALVQQYQQTCAEVIERYAGHIAQYLGDGILVYFGYPTAHEDDAARAVRTGLEIITALRPQVPSPSTGEGQGEGEKGLHSQHPPHPTLLPQGEKELRRLQVRIGIHTGPVVVSEIGRGERRELLALGETPNIAARIQGVAESNTVVLSAATYRLVTEFFDYQELGTQSLKGLPTPLEMYRVLNESVAQHRLDAVPVTGLTPLVGREEELALLNRRWEQVKDREGQVVLLSGEPGIGKSRLVRELRDRAAQDNAVRIEFRCSPYYQNSALQPVIEHLQRLLQWQKDDTPQTKLNKLQTTLTRYHFPQPDTLPLFAALLSLPHPADTPPLNMSPQRQKQKTQEALIAWLMEEAERAPLYCAWEDLHWADPSTLELLGRLIEQTPTTRLFVLLTSRPEFTPPWGQHGHLSQLTLSRLGKRQAPQMIAQIVKDKPLPAEVVQQIVAKTDGVPLFVEELTKMVLESGLLIETNGQYELNEPLPPLAIPSTLQDSLMARLDRLAITKEIAQLGTTIGREFSYDVLHAVSPLDEQTLQHGLKQLVGAELLYQRGTPPHASYLIKHALIQDTAYQSLLKSKRQQLHQQIAQVLEERFPETKDTQPELLAHHYTEAGLTEQAIPCWEKAGKYANQRSAHVEAIDHLTKGLELLKTLPDTQERAHQELSLQVARNRSLMITKGYAAPEVEQALARARELCRQIGETPQLFSVLRGLYVFYSARAELQTAYEIAEQLLNIAQNTQDSGLLLVAHISLGHPLCFSGEFFSARTHEEAAITLYDPQQHHSLASLYGQDPGVVSLSYAAWISWFLGYPDQALKRSQEALTLAQKLAHPFSLAYAFGPASSFHQCRGETQTAQKYAQELITISIEPGFVLRAVWGEILQGWALAEQGQGEEGIAQIHHSLAVYQATGTEVLRPYFLALLAETYGKVGQAKEGLSVLAKALDIIAKTGERMYEAELYRLKGELTLKSKASLEQVQGKSQTSQNKWAISTSQSLTPSTQAEVEQEAEECFLKAIEIAQKQQAKSLELRATMSLARLWQSQGKQREARDRLSAIYNWFTEGFDTKDLQEAKMLIEELGH